MEEPPVPEGPDQPAGAYKRLGELLQTQRDRFQDRLALLDNQRAAILRGDTEALLSYVEIEESMVRDILNIQKAIAPLERDLAAAAAGEDAEIDTLRAAVEALGGEASARAERNRSLLAERMAEIQAEIKSLRGNPYAARPSIYADKDPPRMIDIEG